MLDQEHPLHYQALPADLVPTDYVGRVAFMENPEHPVFAGLDQADFFTWSGDHVVYRNVYRRPPAAPSRWPIATSSWATRPSPSARSTTGLMVLCQMVVGEKLATDPVAQRLFDNLLAYCDALRAGARRARPW